jgi:transposase
MKAYSVDLRKRVLAALDRGMPRSELVTTFQVSLASLKRWHAARRDTGDFTPQPPTGGFEPTITSGQFEETARPSGGFSRCHPGRTRHTLECCPRHHYQPVDDWPCHPPARTDTQKKSLIASERDAWERARFLVEQEDVEAADVVVIDEFGSNLDMTSRYARAPRGERAVASVPRNTPPNTTTISSLTTSGMGPSLMTEGGVTSAMFEAYVEHILGPTLRPGQVILLDNLSAHKSPRLRHLLAARGCQLWYLPSYSPDFSPIELAFAKIKAELRRLGARTREVLEAAVAQALMHISSEDACAFFTHCGFRFRPNLAQWFCP